MKIAGSELGRLLHALVIGCLVVALSGCATTTEETPPPLLDTTQKEDDDDDDRLYMLAGLAVVLVVALPYYFLSGGHRDESPPVLKFGTDEEVKAAAIMDATGAIAAKKPSLYHLLKRQSLPPGIPPEDVALAKKLRRRTLKYESTSEEDARARLYAETYNRMMLQHLQGVPPSPVGSTNSLPVAATP